MSQITESQMRKISIAKVVLLQITGQKPSPRHAKATQRDWGVHKGEPIGVAVTLRRKPSLDLIKRLFAAKGNQISGSSFDNFGNLSLGIKEHIDIPGVKYDPTVGILGLN